MCPGKRTVEIEVTDAKSQNPEIPPRGITHKGILGTPASAERGTERRSSAGVAETDLGMDMYR